MLDDEQLADILLDSDLIGRDELEKAVAQNPDDESLYRSLVRGDLIDEGTLAQLLSELLNVEYVDVADETPDDNVLELLPREMALEHETLPLDLEREDGAVTLIVAMSDPIDMMAMDEVASHTGIDIRPLLSGPRSLREAIDRCYPPVEPDDEQPGEPGGIEDVDPTARRPAPPPQDSAQDDVNASVPGRPVTDSDDGGSQAFELEAIEEADGSGDAESAGGTDDEDDLPEQREPTRSELGRIAVERVAVSRDDVDEDGNLRPEALGDEESETSRHSTDDKPESLNDPERRERLEELVQSLDERSDTLLEDEAAESPDPRGDATGEEPDPDTPSDFDEPFAAQLAQRADEPETSNAADRLKELGDDELLRAALLALVDKGVVSVSEILEQTSNGRTLEREADERTADQESDDESDEPSRNTDQGTGPTFPSIESEEERAHGLGEISSEVG